MKTILGTGQVGMEILACLLERNPAEEILLINRSGKIDIPLPDNVKIQRADVTNADEMRTVFLRSEVVFNCTDVPYYQWTQFYPTTTTALADALRNSQARLVFADNLYSYGNVKGAVMQEEMPHIAQTPKGMARTHVLTTLLGAESTVRNRVAFVKAADFIGPRIEKGVFGTEFLHKFFNRETVNLYGSTDLPHTFTYIRDFAVAMVNVSEALDAFGQVWHVPNAPALSQKEWLRLFESQSGLTAKYTSVNKTAIWLVGWFNKVVKEFYELSYQFEYPYLVSHQHYAARFGNGFTPPETIVKQTIDWYQSNAKKHENKS